MNNCRSQILFNYLIRKACLTLNARLMLKETFVAKRLLKIAMFNIQFFKQEALACYLKLAFLGLSGTGAKYCPLGQGPLLKSVWHNASRGDCAVPGGHRHSADPFRPGPSSIVSGQGGPC